MCHLHDPNRFGNILNILCAALSLIAVILEIVAFILAKDLILYGEKSDAINYRTVEFQDMSGRQANGVQIK